MLKRQKNIFVYFFPITLKTWEKNYIMKVRLLSPSTMHFFPESDITSKGAKTGSWGEIIFRKAT